jgi:hypothetical protein
MGSLDDAKNPEKNIYYIKWEHSLNNGEWEDINPNILKLTKVDKITKDFWNTESASSPWNKGSAWYNDQEPEAPSSNAWTIKKCV